MIELADDSGFAVADGTGIGCAVDRLLRDLDREPRLARLLSLRDTLMAHVLVAAAEREARRLSRLRCPGRRPGQPWPPSPG